MEESERIGFYSIGINTFLVGIKYGLAVFSGSIALAADAIHSLSDIISSVTVLVGIKISKRKSEIFPYDLYKVENLVSSLFIFFAGYEIAVSVFSEEQKLNIGRLPLAITGVLLTILITFLFSRYESQRERIEGIIEAIIAEENLPRGKIDVKIVASERVLAAISSEARRHDLVIIGPSPYRFLRHMLFGRLAEAVAKNCETPVMMVKSKKE